MGSFFSLLGSLSAKQAVLAVLDILLVWFLIYWVFLLIRGTRAVQAVLGFVLLGAALMISRYLDLTTLGWLLDNVLSYVIILAIVIFQPEIRRVLMQVGLKIRLPWGQTDITHSLDEVLAAIQRLAGLSQGALLVFEREAVLDEWVKGGVVMDSRISSELLMAIFRPSAENPIHDGAVIIRDWRIAKAAVLLPLTSAEDLDARLGTRHRAAIGITEETDAVSLVVSEERGEVSVCFHGNIVMGVEMAKLKNVLSNLLRRGSPKQRSWVDTSLHQHDTKA